VSVATVSGAVTHESTGARDQSSWLLSARAPHFPSTAPDRMSGILARSHQMKLLKRFATDTEGAAALEYGLLVAGISLAIIAVVQGLGTNLNTVFGSVQTALSPPAA
jgi:pilus assembly protein Flp/PilA